MIAWHAYLSQARQLNARNQQKNRMGMVRVLFGILPDVLSKGIDPNLSGPVVFFTSVKSCFLPQAHSRLGVREHQAPLQTMLGR